MKSSPAVKGNHYEILRNNYDIFFQGIKPKSLIIDKKYSYETRLSFKTRLALYFCPPSNDK